MRINHIVLAAALFLSLGAFAQHNEEITIEGTYRPKVNKVDKILMQPEKPKQSFEMPSVEVKVLDIDHRFPLELEKLSPLGYYGKNNLSAEPAKNFLMTGFGSRISPLFLYQHHSNLTKNLGLGVGIKHYSSWLDIKDYAPSSFMNNALNIGLTSSKYKGVQLSGDVYYKNDMYHYYGLNLNGTTLTEAQIEQYCPSQIYNTIGTHFGLASTTTRVGELSHSGDVDLHYTFDNTYARELFGGLGYGLAYTQNWWGNKSHPQKIGVDLAFQYELFDSSHFNGFDPVIGRNDLYLMKVNPFFEMGDEFYKLHLGIRLDGVNRIQNKDKFLAVYPDVSGSLFVLNKKLEFYAGLNGGRKLLTYSEIIGENPFANCDFGLLAQNVKLGFDGGMRTNIAEVVDLHLGVRYRHTDNDPFFVGDPLSFTAPFPASGTIYNAFRPVYDESRRVSVLADMRLKLRNGLSADMGFYYHHYDLSTYSYAWHRPLMEGRIKLAYEVNARLSFNTSFLYQGGRHAAYATSYSGNTLQVAGARKLKDVFDLGLGADYRVNDQLSVFAKLDNVANQKYQIYYDYPVEGIQVFAGLKMRF